MQLVLQPCSDADAREHYVDTIENPVPLSRILPHLAPGERAAVAAAFPDSVAVWGATPGKNGVNASKWERIRLGDAVLLYRNRRFFFRGTVAYKTHSQALARELWQSKADGSTWEHIFFLTDLEPVDISIERFNSAAGYQPNFIVQGFNVLPHDRSESILEALELDPGIGASLPSEADVAAARASLDALQGDLNTLASVKRRNEQIYLRTILLGKKRSECCAICGRNLPVNLLVIGHIRKRHSCSVDHKKDLNNVMPVCVLGCDSLFEHGYIYVDGAGEICTSAESAKTPELLLATSALSGLRCGAWSAASEPFFSWHRKHPRKFT